VTEPRPTIASPEVLVDATRKELPWIISWLQKSGIYESQNDNEDDLLAHLSLAIIESADFYAAAKYLEDFYEWPVDGTLCQYLERCYSAALGVLPEHVMDWTMRTQTRFPAKEGDDVQFVVGSVNITGTVVAVVAREARGHVKMRNGTIMPVTAEEVVKVLKTKQPGPNNTPPEGGTPMAPVGGALLKRALVA